MSAQPRILVACVGNVFFGDDGFGVEVAACLRGRRLPEGVEVVDFGIRGMDLAYALLEDWGGAILVDAAPRGGEPGILYLLEPELEADSGPVSLDTHAMDPVRVLRLVRALGGELPTLRVIGCEPEAVGAGEGDMREGLSAPVRAAVERAADLVVSVADEMREEAAVA